MALDTHAAVKTLTAVGAGTDPGEAVVAVPREAGGSDVATKTDPAELKGVPHTRPSGSCPRV